MAADLSKLSDSDLQAMANNDMTKMSEQGLQYLSSSADNKSSGADNESSGTDIAGMALGAAGLGVNAVQHAGQFVANHPIASAAAGAMIPGVNRLPGLNQINQFGSSAVDALHNYNLNNMADTIRKGERFGQDMSQLKDVYNQRITQMSPRPTTVPTGAPAPTVPPETPGPATNFLQNIASKYQQVAQQLRPAMQAAPEAIGRMATVAAPYMAAIGGMMPATTNANEQAELARHRQMAPTITPPGY